MAFNKYTCLAGITISLLHFFAIFSNNSRGSKFLAEKFARTIPFAIESNLS
ncbi:MAG: hypothetical protein ACFE9V_19660 [Candidatus Hodarchaeota archaeon]